MDVGSAIIEVNTSLYLAGTIFFLANFIIFIKRFMQVNNFKNKHFKLLYSKKKLNLLIFSSSFLFFTTLITFIYFIKIELIILIPMLMYIFLRYYKSAIVYNLGEFPFELIMKDKIILLSSILVIIYTVFIYY